jgi:hypothetical protein
VRSLPALALAVGVVALAACGGDDGPANPDPATLAPADAVLYVEAVPRPEGEAREGAEAGLAKLLDSDDPGAFIVEQLDRGLAEEDVGITFEEDVEPWLGERAGLFLSGVDSEGEMTGAALVAVTDPDAALETVDELLGAAEEPVEDRTYGGVTYRASEQDDAVGIVGDFLVAGSEAGFMQAVDASEGEQLASDDGYKEAIAVADEDRLLTLYAVPGPLLEELAASGELAPGEADELRDQLGAAAEGPLVAWVTLGSDRLSLAGAAAAAGGPPPGEAALLGDLPSDSWLALGGADLGESIEEALTGAALGAELDIDVGGVEAIERELGIDVARDLTSWLGDGAAFVSGTSLFGVGGGVVVQTTDKAASARAIQLLGAALEEAGVELRPSGVGAGYEFRIPGAPVAAEVVQDGDRVVAVAGGVSLEDVLDPGSNTLEDSEAFQAAREALGDGFEVGLYLRLVDLLRLVEGVPGVGADPDFRQVRRFLDHLDYLVAGARREGDLDVAALTIGLLDAPDSEAATTSASSP